MHHDTSRAKGDSGSNRTAQAKPASCFAEPNTSYLLNIPRSPLDLDRQLGPRIQHGEV